MRKTITATVAVLALVVGAAGTGHAAQRDVKGAPSLACADVENLNLEETRYSLAHELQVTIDLYAPACPGTVAYELHVVLDYFGTQYGDDGAQAATYEIVLPGHTTVGSESVSFTGVISEEATGDHTVCHYVVTKKLGGSGKELDRGPDDGCQWMTANPLQDAPPSGRSYN